MRVDRVSVQRFRCVLFFARPFGSPSSTSKSGSREPPKTKRAEGRKFTRLFSFFESRNSFNGSPQWNTNSLTLPQTFDREEKKRKKKLSPVSPYAHRRRFQVKCRSVRFTGAVQRRYPVLGVKAPLYARLYREQYASEQYGNRTAGTKYVWQQRYA